MQANILGIINLIHAPDEMGSLTANRCLASVPFGGQYRLIDFVLSSMANSGITKVGVFAHTKYRGLMDHLDSGKHWDLEQPESGLSIIPPNIMEHAHETNRGDLYHFYENQDYFKHHSCEYVLITRGYMICNVDYKPVLAAHQASGADITVICKQSNNLMGGKARKVKTDAGGRITSIAPMSGEADHDLISMEMYIMRKELFLDLVDTSLAQGQDHLVEHAIMGGVDQLHIQSYMHEGCLGVVNTLASYYENSMQLLRPGIRRGLFAQQGSIITKLNDEPPARYVEGSRASNSIIANGCIIEGTVINSILFEGVHVRKGAVVRDSIVMCNSVIDDEGFVDHVILDKEVRLASSKRYA
ncbi:glucose-1-phosphate adenylyltransferase subunit GlgD [Paenibacillus sp. CF384]|uniref:glucose-1-phosphate adenylyltransferase subunit GlgD n=1 Tax=Paenibacillus sp. CF384 TaxID=1884382 RepID=UPI00089A6EA9|nr:glucose-1-phosphate adenylyltransferase subunit GlgD [Paenibacillus sp. CF384]SDW82560.1 glucose-1-phosphate adenylyltransferase [Paenibacillus sp. CF384]